MDQTPELSGRILLVDDEAAILRTFRYCLEDRGYTVVTAASAAQAESILQRQVFDLCFLDLRLGEDNGLDVLAHMRVVAPWMRVVIVTAHSAVDTAVDAMQAGAADYLVKPCSPEQLRLAAAKQLEVRQMAARLEALEGEMQKRSDALGSNSPMMMGVLETARQSPTPMPTSSSSASPAPARASWRTPSTPGAGGRRRPSSPSTARHCRPT